VLSLALDQRPANGPGIAYKMNEMEIVSKFSP